ncbi:MAG: hypothetical protein EB039_13790, partial [Proteobacteria bacterium]|nr:hypothetical protein [Pseudomonadota bacterium]
SHSDKVSKRHICNGSAAFPAVHTMPRIKASRIPMCDHLPEIGGWTMSSAGQILVVVPDLGDSVTEATLTHWLATVGTIVEPGEAIAEVTPVD